MGYAQKPYYFLSFLPALAYWYLETYYTLEVALSGGIILGVVEMMLERILTGHVHTLSKFNISLIVLLGGISFVAQEGIFFKLQPTLTGLAVSAFLMFKKIKGQSLMLEMLKDLKISPPWPEELYMKMEFHLAVFFIVFASLMAGVALYSSTSTWVFMKTAGLYIAFGGFLLVEMLYLRSLTRGIRK